MDEPVLVNLRGPEGPVQLEWAQAETGALSRAAPWRTFRWVRGQCHYSGTFWAATERGHVIYESRLELARLLFADFDPGVSRIMAQPFQLETVVDGVVRRHVPDFLLVDGAGPVVVDVKPRRRLAEDRVAASFAWTCAAVEGRGWRFEVWSEPPAAELENIRFLAGYRRSWLFDPDLLDALREAVPDVTTLGDAFRTLPGFPPELVRSALLHLLWRQEWRTDLSSPLSGRHQLRRPA